MSTESTDHAMPLISASTWWDAPIMGCTHYSTKMERWGKMWCSTKKIIPQNSLLGCRCSHFLVARHKATSNNSKWLTNAINIKWWIYNYIYNYIYYIYIWIIPTQILLWSMDTNGAPPSPLAFALGIAPKDLCSLRGELRWDSQLMGQPQGKMGRTHGLKITRKPCQNRWTTVRYHSLL